jgi:drug/metabolite transporter (DMT)-like permease
VQNAVIWGAVTALCWGLAALATPAATRIGGTWQPVMLSSAVSAAIAAVVALFTGVPQSDSGLGHAIVAGLAYSAAVPLWFAAIRFGRMSSIAPIVATDGAIAAALALATGDPVTGRKLGALGLLSCGVVLVAAVPARDVGRSVAGGHTRPRAAMVLAFLAAAAYGLSFFASGRAVELGGAWVAWMTRGCAALVALVAAVAGRTFVWSRPLVLWSVLIGCLDIAGALAYLKGVETDLAVTVVLASQYAAVGTAGGLALFGERLAKHQIAGALMIFIGVGAVSAT